MEEGYQFIQDGVYLKTSGSRGMCCMCTEKPTRKANCWVDPEHCDDHYVCERHWGDIFGMYLTRKFVRFGFQYLNRG